MAHEALMHDLSRYTGHGPQPGWSPDCGGFRPGVATPLDRLSVIFDDVLSPEACASLIAQFDQQEVYPVGIDGYANDLDRIGSFRAMAWAVDLAAKMAPVFEAMPKTLTTDDLPAPLPISGERTFTRLGSTPWMRFMRYKTGGMHVPHYDAPFESPAESYITLFSWVLYLNDIPAKDGGSFDFVDHRNQPVEASARTDWRRMAEPNEIMTTIQPKRGRLLVFPHWLCHQVNAYTGPDQRYIIRGDLAYGVE